MLTLCAMVILSPISANLWSHHQRSSTARHIQSWARFIFMLARIHAVALTERVLESRIESYNVQACSRQLLCW
jgi:hypothetical protein